MKRNDFTGCVALLTGAGGGIGSAIARRLEKLGFSLAFVGRDIKKLEALGIENAYLIQGDLSKRDFLESVIGRVLSRFGQLDVLINNAGTCFVSEMKDTGYDALETMLKTNVTAPYILCRDAIEPMKSSDCASIINIGSVVSHKGYATQSAYATAKHALLGMTKALAAEVYKDDIRVHILTPGAVNTSMARTIARPDIDMSVLIEPEDLADVIEFLLTHRTNSVIDEVSMHRAGKQPFC